MVYTLLYCFFYVLRIQDDPSKQYAEKSSYCYNPFCKEATEYYALQNNTKCSLYIWKKDFIAASDWHSCQLLNNNYKLDDLGFRVPSSTIHAEFGDGVVVGIHECKDRDVTKDWGTKTNDGKYIKSIYKWW